MRATVTLSPDGTADVASSGQSMSAEQATADAAELESEVDKATSIKVAFVKLRVFGPVKFRAEGDLVKSDVHLTQDDIDKIFGLVAAFMPR